MRIVSSAWALISLHADQLDLEVRELNSSKFCGQSWKTLAIGLCSSTPIKKARITYPGLRVKLYK